MVQTSVLLFQVNLNVIYSKKTCHQSNKCDCPSLLSFLVCLESEGSRRAAERARTRSCGGPRTVTHAAGGCQEATQAGRKDPRQVRRNHRISRGMLLFYSPPFWKYFAIIMQMFVTVEGQGAAEEMWAAKCVPWRADAGDDVAEAPTGQAVVEQLSAIVAHRRKHPH